MAPVASVVIVTRDRAERLADALASLRVQTQDAGTFEVLVVDDGSRDDTSAVVAREQERARFALRLVSREIPGGPAVARNDGWRAARGALVAFLDDDCVATPGWLTAGIRAWGERDDRFVQGSTTPIPEEAERLGRWSYSYDIRALDVDFSTCNMFYPRALLERLGGFDAEAFTGWGEDTDVAWRARAAGAEPLFAADALAHHAVVELGPWRFLVRTHSLGGAVWLLARHPPLRRERLVYRVFFNHWHYWVTRLWIAVLLPQRLWLLPLKLWLALPWLRFRSPHPRTGRPSAANLAWFLLADSAEVAGVLRGAVRHRVVVV